MMLAADLHGGALPADGGTAGKADERQSDLARGDAEREDPADGVAVDLVLRLR